MPAFISKLQYKTCEDGEYYEEQARTLEETLALINNFPWERERYAEIDLTGPSVTIVDNDCNFLKIGIHYGGTFHIYYLNKENRFYERYPIHIDDVEEMVIDFFERGLNLQQLEKQPWTYLQRQYFLTKNFNYAVKPWQVFFCTFWITLTALAFTIIFILGLFNNPTSITTGVYLALTATLFWVGPIYCFVKMQNYKGQHLHIARGSNEFTFGNTLDETKTYNKADVVKIITTTSINRKQPFAITFTEVVFKDSSSIRFPNLLSVNLAQKFPMYFKPEWVIVKKWILVEL